MFLLQPTGGRRAEDMEYARGEEGKTNLRKFVGKSPLLLKLGGILAWRSLPLESYSRTASALS